MLIWEVVKIRAPFWATLNNRCRTMFGTQKTTIILTTTYMGLGTSKVKLQGINYD